MSFWNRILFLEAKRILNWYFHSNLQTRGLIIIFYTKYITSQKKTRTISRKYVHLPLDLQSKYRCESKFVRFNPRWWKKSNQSRHTECGQKRLFTVIISLFCFCLFSLSLYFDNYVWEAVIIECTLKIHSREAIWWANKCKMAFHKRKDTHTHLFESIIQWVTAWRH